MHGFLYFVLVLLILILLILVLVHHAGGSMRIHLCSPSGTCDRRTCWSLTKGHTLFVAAASRRARCSWWYFSFGGGLPDTLFIDGKFTAIPSRLAVSRYIMP